MISRRGETVDQLVRFSSFIYFDVFSKLIILIKKGRLGYDSIVKRPPSSSGERSAKKLFCDQEDLTASPPFIFLSASAPFAATTVPFFAAAFPTLTNRRSEPES
ncbi:hypothetical protein MtrunA17_Chr0c03g0489961 [Medicago truncatula]|uniref:Transmembrane protein n=1 Tax=Medicago truncatula TaxID=3880 RepID=A0A396GIJ1_MEDTR|nr:hypothetical protein MtrunA17_Chr0c03g0489961 [Medicago truncatula]